MRKFLKRLTITLLSLHAAAVVTTLATAQEQEVVQVREVGNGLIECRVDGVAMPRRHNDVHTGTARAVNLKLMNPDSSVVCERTQTFIPTLTTFGRQFVEEAHAALIVIPEPTSQNFYVDADGGNDLNDGSEGSPFATVGHINGLTLQPGANIYFQSGDTHDDASLNITDSGTSGNPITIGSYGVSGTPPILRETQSDGDWVVYDGIDFDQNGGNNRIVRIRGDNNVLRNSSVHNGTNDGVDIRGGATNFTIDNNDIYLLLDGSYGSGDDAHGIAVRAGDGNTITGTISNNRIRQVSGDSLQSDPDRLQQSDSNPENYANYSVTLTLDGNTFYTEALTSTFSAGNWDIGDIPGEDGIDTKANAVQSGSVTLNISDHTCYGFTDIAEITNRTCFNFKENATMTLDGATLYDQEHAFRIRNDAEGNPTVDAYNVVVYDSGRAIRVESNVTDVTFYNSTFGSGITDMIQEVDGGFSTGEDFQNNVWFTAVPSELASPPATNVSAVAGDFGDESANDYRPLDTATSIVDSGTTLGAVTEDRDGVTRSAPYNIGSYETTISTAAGENAYHDNYLSQAPFSTTVQYSFPMRSTSEVAAVNGYPSSRVTYDSSEDAARLRLPVGLQNGTSETMNGGNAGAFDVSPVANSGVWVLYWQAKWDSQYGIQGAINTHKYVRGDGSETNSANRGFETRAGYGGSSVGFSIRAYPGSMLICGDSEPSPNPAFSGDYDVWIDQWYIIDFDNDRFWAAAASENATTPVFYHNDCAINWSTADQLIDEITMSWNTSQNPSDHTSPLDSWFRNFLFIDGWTNSTQAISAINERPNY